MCANEATAYNHPGGPFKKGCQAGPGRPQRTGAMDDGSTPTTSDIRSDFFQHWRSGGPDDVRKFLDRLRKDCPRDYANFMAGFVPKQDSAVVRRSVLFSLTPKGPPADWKPMSDEDLEGDSEEAT